MKIRNKNPFVHVYFKIDNAVCQLVYDVHYEYDYKSVRTNNISYEDWLDIYRLDAITHLNNLYQGKETTEKPFLHFIDVEVEYEFFSLFYNYIKYYFKGGKLSMTDWMYEKTAENIDTLIEFYSKKKRL